MWSSVTSGGGCLFRLERDVLVRRRVGVARDQSEPGLADAWAHPVQERELPDGRIDDALLDELLDPLQGRLAPLDVGLRGLLAEEAVEIGIAAVDVGAILDHEGFEARGGVAEGA